MLHFARAAAILSALLVALALSACRRSVEPALPAGPLRIVCTTGMVADVARNVAGEHAQVITLMGEGIDPHLYKPTRSDMNTLMTADVVFYNGLLLEGKLTDALVKAANAGRKAYPVTELIPADNLLTPEDFEGHEDPHVWMDPLAWATTADVVRDRLSELAPAHADTFAANAETYKSAVRELHTFSQACVDSIPSTSRVLVTAHDAFNYFGRRYGFEVVGIQGISTESEAGVRDIELLVELLVSRKIPAVFVESTVSERNIEALVAGAARRGHTVSIGGSLFSDAMGTPGTPEGTYPGMIRHNIATITTALGGTIPADHAASPSADPGS